LTLVEKIEAKLGPLPPRIRAAYAAVDRTRYVRPCDRPLADEDWPLPLDTPHGAAVPPAAELIARHGAWERALMAPDFRAAGATISAPLMYALAFRLLDLAEGHRLLELGSGTGYGAALAAEVVGDTGRVTSVEVDPFLVAAARANCPSRVTIEHADGLTRPDLIAACERAWLTFSVESLPQPLLDALPEGAVLLAPIGPPPPSPQRWLRFRRTGSSLEREELPFPVYFIAARPLIGAVIPSI
jgi:protein-L-isoaspartate O-methyltransferase